MYFSLNAQNLRYWQKTEFLISIILSGGFAALPGEQNVGGRGVAGGQHWDRPHGVLHVRRVGHPRGKQRE